MVKVYEIGCVWEEFMRVIVFVLVIVVLLSSVCLNVFVVFVEVDGLLGEFFCCFFVVN